MPQGDECGLMQFLIANKGSFRACLREQAQEDRARPHWSNVFLSQVPQVCSNRFQIRNLIPGGASASALGRWH